MAVEPEPEAADSAPARQKILMFGMRRAGKSSLCKVVFQSFQPNDTLFLPPTTRIQHINVTTFQQLEIWDIPGSMLEQALPRAVGVMSAGASAAAAGLTVPWHQVGAVVFVVDAQDDYVDALMRLNQVILLAYSRNPQIHFHFFINKVDGLSEDYKYDTQRDIEQRVYEELIDSSHEIENLYTGEPVKLDEEVNLRFHFTSVFDASVFVAFSRLQQWLMQGTPESSSDTDMYDPRTPQGMDVSDPLSQPRPELVSLHDAVETACNLLCASSQLQKAYVFDIPSRTFIGCDSSPFDMAVFDVMIEYIKFLSQFADLYANVSHAPTITARHPEGAPPTELQPRKWSASTVRLEADTSLAFWQLNEHLALLGAVRTNIYMYNAGILDYNVSVFRPMSVDDAPAAAENTPVDQFPARTVAYCDICTFPYEYCEYGSSLTKCKTHLEEKDPALYAHLYSEAALTDKLRELTTEQVVALERDSAKRERKAEAKAEKERAQLATSKIVLSRGARTKRKVITSVHGLHLFSPPLPPLRAIAKGLSTRFATGAAVTQSVQHPGIEEIHIQGDLVDDIKTMLVQRAKPFDTMQSEADGGLAEKNILIDEKGNK
ncbi:Translation machinery-associated protein 22 [Malassezia sp. CBS 17886]|nr:Translation machinery-associated protein 22 [Malassezia sp. CBS 17886]